MAKKRGEDSENYGYGRGTVFFALDVFISKLVSAVDCELVYS